MFKVGDLKIEFQRMWENDNTFPENEHGSGRYDTKCEIYVDDDTKEVPRFTGVARLHPNDKPDKIVGKKIALFKAMGLFWKMCPFYDAFGRETQRPVLHCSNNTFDNKKLRTKIWKAFWALVKSWKEQSKIDSFLKQELCEVCHKNPAGGDGECADCRH